MTKSTILLQQRSLFRQIDRHIICKFPNDSTIIASEITEEDFPKLQFVINDIKNSSAPMTLVGIDVYLIDKITNVRDITPIDVPGLLAILQATMENSEEVALVHGQLDKNTYYTPFLYGIGAKAFEKEDDPNIPPVRMGPTISQVIDTLSSLNVNMPDTSKYNKRFTLILDPPLLEETECKKTELREMKEKEFKSREAKFWCSSKYDY